MYRLRSTRNLEWKLTLGTLNVTSLMGKEPELVYEMGRYELDIVAFTSTQGSGTKHLDQGW